MKASALTLPRTRFIRSKKRSGRLLDIGCGYGYFAAACREKGYEVQGIDVSEWAAQHAVQRLGIPVSIGKINEIELTPHSFDIITMWHFLEHVPDPHLVLQKAKTWLKKDGILVIDVPNYQSTDAKREWQDWVGWQLPYHFWHFNLESLGLLLGQHGYGIIKKKDYHSEVIKNQIKRIPVFGLLARMIAKLYSGTSVAVIAKQST
jgi:SAM-dependent methyltransferase